MADRRSVFTSAEVIELSASFICAADEVWRLQRGSEADCLFFQRAVNGGERITDKGSRQGTWIFAPSGKLLTRVNTRDPGAQLATMHAALAAFEALPAEERALAPDAELDAAHRWEDSFPEDGLALERIVRELDDEGAAARSWNRDFAWFSEAEIDAAMPADLSSGERIELPLLAQRLARFHLVDNARGQTLPYAPAEVERAQLIAIPRARVGERWVVDLTGSTRADAGDEWLGGETLWKPKRVEPHGISCSLAGRATWNAKERRFEKFELAGVAHHWGKTVMNGRWRDDSPGKLAFFLQRTERRIAPAFVGVYDAEWIERPSVPTWRDSPSEAGLETD